MALAAGLIPAQGFAQQAPYLKGQGPWYENATGISGLWNQTEYRSSGDFSPRERTIRDVNGNPPPMLPETAKVLEQRLVDAEHNKPYANTASVCLPQGVPYMLHAAVGGPLQILETPGQVTFINDAYNEMWFVYLDQKHPPLDDIEPNYHGDSVGHWEGDTLVIDTYGLTTRTTLDQVGTPHSDKLHVITKVTRSGPDTIQFRITIDDPGAFSRTWEEKTLIYKRANKDARISEVVCENNRNVVLPDGHQSLSFSESPFRATDPVPLPKKPTPAKKPAAAPAKVPAKK